MKKKDVEILLYRIGLEIKIETLEKERRCILKAHTLNINRIDQILKLYKKEFNKNFVENFVEILDETE